MSIACTPRSVRLVCRPGVLLLLALGGLLLPAARAEDAPAAANRWNDAEFLRSVIGPACDAIEAVEGVAFPRRPELVLSDRAVLADLLVEEMGTIFRRLGARDDAEVAQTARTVAQMLMAKYAPATNTIHLVLGNVEEVTRLMGAEALRREGVMRMLLVHECAHALDFQRFPALEEQRQQRETADGIQAVGAVLEGHAQWVTEQVAERWGAQEDFAAITGLITGLPAIEDPAARLVARVLASEIEFAYVQGHRFMRAVASARGRAGVEAVLRAPPASTRQIENPREYLTPGAAVAFAPEPFLGALGQLVPEGWPTQVAPLKRSQVRAALATLPAETLDPLLEAFVDGVGWIARSPAGGQVITACLLWRDEAGAQRYLRDMRTLHELREEEFREGSVRIVSSEFLAGVGRGARHPGLRVRRVLEVHGETVQAEAHFAALGSHAVELSFVGPVDVAGLTFDEWTDRVLVALGLPAPADPQAAPPPAPEPGAAPEPAPGAAPPPRRAPAPEPAPPRERAPARCR